MLRNISKVTFDIITQNVPQIKDRIIDNIFSKDRVFKTSYSLDPNIVDISSLEEALEQFVDGGLSTDLIKYFRSNEIDFQIPGELKGLIQTNPSEVAFFVGAGASKLLKYPTWEELANKAIERLESKNYITSYEKDIFQKEIKDPKIKLSLFENRLSREETLLFYKEELKKQIDKDNSNNIYKILVSEVFENCIKLTTNVDQEFAVALGEKLALNKQSCTDNSIVDNVNSTPINELAITPNDQRLETELNPNVIYYLHGFIENENDELIFSTTSYLEHYFQDGKDKTPLKKFLDKLFEKCTVIFLGTSLEELQILEVVRKTKKKHYALMPTYFENLQLLELKAQYLKSLNLIILPYFLDNEGFSRLYKVLDAWKNETQINSPKGVDFAILISENIKNDKNEDQILYSIKEDPKKYIYLLRQPINSSIWFYKLKTNGLLESDYQKDNSELLFQRIIFLNTTLKGAIVNQDSKLIKDIVIALKEDYLQNKVHLIDASFYYHLNDIIINLPENELDLEIIDLLIKGAGFASDTPLLPEKYSLFNKLFPRLIKNQKYNLAFSLLEKYYCQILLNLTNGGEKYDIGIYSEISRVELFNDFAKTITINQLKTLCELFSLSNLIKYKAFLMTIESEKFNAGLTFISDTEIRIKIYNKTESQPQSKYDTIFERTLEISIFKHTEDEILEKINNEIPEYGPFLDLGIQYFTGLFYSSVKNIFELDNDTYNLNEDIFSVIVLIVKEKNESFDEFIKYLLDPKYKDVNLKRLLIFILNNNWKAHEEIYEYILKNSHLFFQETAFEHDLRVLFKNNVSSMNINQKQNLLDTILDSCKLVVNTKDYPRSKEYCIYKWLSSVENDDFFKEIATEHSTSLSLKPNHFDNIGRVQVSGFHSPIKYEEFMDKEPSEVIEILKSVKGNWIENTSSDRMAETFAKTVFDNIEHFKWILSKYNQIPYFFSYYLIKEFEERFNNKVPINWVFILTFIEKYIKGESFKSGSLSCGNEYFDSNNDVLTEICSFISSISNNDDHSFPNAEQKRVLNILLMSAYPEQEITKDVDFNFPTYTYNIPSGVKLHAIVQLSLNLARKSDMPVGNKWNSQLRIAFEKFLDGEHLSAYIIIGMYFPQFCYLDQLWVENKINQFDGISETNWKGFFGGLVFQGAQGSKEIFEKILKKHFVKAINIGFFQDKMIHEGYIQALTQYIYWDYIDSSDALLFLFLDKCDVKAFRDFVRKIGFDKKRIEVYYKDEKYNLLTGKIINLWDKILEFSKLKDSFDNLYLWIKYIDLMTEDNYNRIKKISETLTSQSHLYDFWEEIDRLLLSAKDEEMTGIWISDIIKSMLEKELNDTQVQCEDVKKILQKLSTLTHEITISNCKQIKDLLIDKYFCSFKGLEI
jgi:hypothetical protein